MADKLRGVVAVQRKVRSHPSNSGHLLSALLRAYSFEIRSELAGVGEPVLVTTGFGPRLRVSADHHASTRAAFARLPDANEMAAWQRLLRPGDLFVDVGANVGLYTLLAASASARVLAVEADPLALAELNENVRLNDYSGLVRIVHAAASDSDGTMTFTSGLDEMNRILTDGASRGAASTTTVASVALDTAVGISTVRGCKVDVEGFERLVLEGFRGHLSEHRVDVLQLEWNYTSLENMGETRAPVRDLLQSFGYLLARPDVRGNLHHVADPELGADVFAVRSELAGLVAGSSLGTC